MTDLGGVEEAARRRERRLRGVLDALPYLVAQISSDGAVTYVNPTGAAMVDRRSEQIVGRPLTALGYPPPLAATWAAAIGRVTATGTPVPVDYEVVGAGGTRRMEGVFLPEWDEAGNIGSVLAVAGDVTERWRAEQQRRLSEQMLREVLDGSPDVIVRMDRDHRAVYVNQKARLAAGRPADQLVGHTLDEMYPGESWAAQWRQALDEVFTTGAGATVEYPYRTPDAVERWVQARLQALHNAAGEVDTVQVVARDAAAEHTLQLDLERRSLHDPLTGLTNRVLLLDRIEQALHRIHRECRHLLVLFVDLDGFKAVNDSFGHAAGDDVLRQLAARLAATARATDTVGRLGGDEFVIVTDITSDDPDVAPLVTAAILDRYRRIFERPVPHPRHPLTIGASIGAATAGPDDQISAEDLLAEADRAMYVDKRRHPNIAPRPSARRPDTSQ